MTRTLLAMPLLLASIAAPAMPAETRKPNLIYYLVHGTTAKAIRDDIVQNGPKISGSSAFSFTIPAIKISQKTISTKQSCRFKNYRIASVYSFVLPRLVLQKGLPKATQANWNQFASYLRTHENQHREIWLACLSEFESEARSLEARDCEGLAKQAARAFEHKKQSCLEQDKRLDFYYTKEALKTPFLREAAGQ